MDLWVVAAATGAGYLAKYWQNLAGEKDGRLSNSYPGSMHSIHKKLKSQSLLQAIGDQRKLLGNVYSEKEDDGSPGNFQEIGWHGGHSTAEVASTSGGDGNILANSENCGDYTVLPLSNLPLGFIGSRVFQENVDGIGTKETSSSFKILGKKRSLKSRRSRMYIVKPLNSLESCLTSQLNEEHGNAEENACILPPLSTPTVRPLLVVDGNRIIHRVSRDSFDSTKDSVNRPIGLVELPRKPEQSRSRSFHSQEPPNGMLLFFVGISIGIMSTVLENKREVDKLNGLLKQTENLVQDLHDELEMKEMMNIKEIPSEDYQSRQTDNHSSFKHENTESWSEPELLDDFTKYDDKNRIDQKAENPDLMSQIEAELEAELETLELNMKAAILERISDFVELDPDFEPGVVQGDLKLDMAARQPGGPADSDDNASRTSTTHIHTANYAVSPRELNLRLHELIESRLEAHIEELETALQNSQQRVRSLESQNTVSRKGFAYTELGSSFTSKSPNVIGEDDDKDRPLVIYAYDEAYEDRNGATETDQESESEDDDEIFTKLLTKQVLYSMDDQTKIQTEN